MHPDFPQGRGKQHPRRTRSPLGVLCIVGRTEVETELIPRSRIPCGGIYKTPSAGEAFGLGWQGGRDTALKSRSALEKRCRRCSRRAGHRNPKRQRRIVAADVRRRIRAGRRRRKTIRLVTPAAKGMGDIYERNM